MDFAQPAGPSVRDWAEATLKVTKVEREGSPQIFELRKQMVINGVLHVQFVWLTHSQLRSVGIDHGL
jgi:hypothetical protein